MRSEPGSYGAGMQVRLRSLFFITALVAVNVGVARTDIWLPALTLPVTMWLSAIYCYRQRWYGWTGWLVLLSLITFACWPMVVELTR